MKTTGRLHGYIGQISFLISKDIFDDPAPFHFREGVFDADADSRQLAIALLVLSRQRAARRLFFLGRQT